MNSFRLIGRNLWFYRKAYLALMAGVMLSTAVLTGALIVGDSVRGSLGHLTELRLGKSRWAMQTRDRFFRARLAGELSAEIRTTVVPVLQLNGIGVNMATGQRTRDLKIIGIDSTFKGLWDHPGQLPGEDEAVISPNLAEKLDLKPGDHLLIRGPNTGKAPQNAPFVAEETPTVSLRLTVTAIADNHNMGRFSLKSDQKAPLNVFVSLRQLAERLEIPGTANLLLVPENEERNLTAAALDSALSHVWQPADAGIEIRQLDTAGILQITSDRIFFEPRTASAIQQALPGSETILTYLANSLSAHGKTAPYSFVSAVNNMFFPAPLSREEVLISTWLATDLGAGSGDSLTISYYVMGPLRTLKEQQAVFRIRGVIPVGNIPFGPAMMPDFPGMSDAGNCRDWETGAPVDMSRIRDKDEAYWNQFRGTPKAFISLEDGQKLWNNPFGTVTEFRLSKGKRELKDIGIAIMQHLTPDQTGMTMNPVYKEGQEAAANSTDFGTLFLSLSFFLIGSALLLSALLFSLHARTRLPEAGILSAIGFRKLRIIRILFTEACIVIMAGGILGTFAAIFYNRLVLFLLNTLWQDAVRTTMLELHVRFTTLITGAATGIGISGCILLLVLLRSFRKPVTSLVKEASLPRLTGLKIKQRIYSIIAMLLLGSAVVLIIFLLADFQSVESGLFLVTGGLILTGSILLTNAFLIRITGKPSVKTPGVARLVLRNAGLKRTRTMASISLLALGTFIIIITGANRKTFYGTEQERQSGTGGFLLWAESTMPLLYDLNTPFGKKHFGLEDEPLVRDARFYQMQRMDGSDASCLNLNQVAKPFLLGVPVNEFDSLRSFQFATLDPEIRPDHPWRELDTALAADLIPAFADQTVITWGLRKSVGDTLNYQDESGKDLRIKLIGGLDNSIFQGHLLVSDKQLRRFYPSLSGATVMLVDGPFEKKDRITTRLEELFIDYGLVATLASQRLSEFNSVENTYLSVFMMLGALGVLIGTVGLGIILFRNLTERKSEFALYLALGFQKKNIFRMLVAEHLLILIAGITFGSVAALAGILPSLISPAFTLPAGFLILLMGLIFISGLCWIYFPARSFLQQNLTQALRNE
ncbi:MAG: ABC transporter permease [bacterium]